MWGESFRFSFPIRPSPFVLLLLAFVTRLFGLKSLRNKTDVKKGKKIFWIHVKEYKTEKQRKVKTPPFTYLNRHQSFGKVINIYWRLKIILIWRQMEGKKRFESEWILFKFCKLLLAFALWPYLRILIEDTNRYEFKIGRRFDSGSASLFIEFS